MTDDADDLPQGYALVHGVVVPEDFRDELEEVGAAAAHSAVIDAVRRKIEEFDKWFRAR